MHDSNISIQPLPIISLTPKKTPWSHIVHLPRIYLPRASSPPVTPPHNWNKPPYIVSPLHTVSEVSNNVALVKDGEKRSCENTQLIHANSTILHF